MFGKARTPQRDLAHGVQRVRNDDENCFRRALYNFIDDFSHNVRICFEKIVTAHAGFARQSGGYDYDVGIRRFLVAVGSRQPHVKSFNRRGFRQIQRFALRHTFDDIDQDDIS